MSTNEPDELEMRRRRRYESLALVFGLLIVGFAYLDSLDGPFIWDDRSLLDQNCVRSLCSVVEYFKLPFWDLGGWSPGAGLLYRPITSFSLALDKALFGQNAAGFHLTNIAFHLLNMTLFAALARRLGSSGFVAAALVTVWGLLPRLSESVAWISGRTDILYTTAAIASLLVWKSEHRGRRFVAIALGLASAFAKEAGIGVMLGLTVAEVMACPPGKRVWRGLVPGGLLLAYLGLRQTVLSAAITGATVPLTLWQRVLTVLEATGRYAWMSIDLWHPKLQIGIVGAPRLGYVAVGVVAIIAIAALLYKLRRKLSALSVAVAITGAIPMLAVIHLMPMPWIAVTGDRLSYLSWGVAACCLAVAVTRVGPRIRYGIPAAILVAVVLGLTLIPCARKRVHLFADEIGLWANMLETTDGSNWGPTVFMSGIYLRGGWPERSLTIVSSLDQRCPSPYPLRLAESKAKVFALQGRYAQAMAILDGEASDAIPKMLLTRARLRLSSYDLDGAEADARVALAKYEGYYEAKQFLHMLARIKQLQSGLSTAVSEFERSMRVAQIDMLSGRLVEAEREWLALLGESRLPKSAADEAFAFMCELGSAGNLRPSIAAYLLRQDAEPVLVAGCQEKLKFSERLDFIWPHVSQVLDNKNSNRVHCSDYGLFSD